MSQQAPTIFDIDDPEKKGIYRDFGSTVKTKTGVNVDNASVYFKGRLVRRSQSTERNWDDVNTAGATFQLAVGEAAAAPESGTFNLAYNGDATGLGALDFDITAADLQTALNANPAVNGAGGVTVELLSSKSYEIRFNAVGVRLLFTTTDTNELRPETAVQIGRDIIGDASTRETQVVTLARKAYAETKPADWTTDNSGAISVVERQAGDAGHKSIQRLEYDAGVEPYDGNLILNFAKPQITRISCLPNTAVKEETTITIDDATTAADLGGKGFYIYPPSGAPRLVWFDVNNASTAPLAPDGGTLVEVDLATAAPAKDISAALKTVLHAHADFTATQSKVAGGYKVLVVNADYGPATDAVDVDSGLGIVTTKQGTIGALNLKAFKLYDANGTVGVWLNSSGATEPPASVLQMVRTIEVVIAPGDTANDVADAIKDELDLDAAFGAILGTSLHNVRVTDAEGGERTSSADIDSGFTFEDAQVGKAMTANVPYDAAEKDFEEAFENYFTVVRRNTGSIDFKAAQVGLQPAIELDSTDLSFPNVIEAEMNLNTARMVKRMASATEDPVEMVIEGRVLFPGRLPHVFLRDKIYIWKAVIAGGAFTPALSNAGYFVDFPAAQNSPGSPGQIACDGNYFAVCYATNAWCYCPMSQAPFPPP